VDLTNAVLGEIGLAALEDRVCADVLDPILGHVHSTN